MIRKATNVDSNNTRNEKGIKENTKMGSTTDEVTVEKVNETLISDNGTPKKKNFKTYAQAVTDYVNKTTDENVSCVMKELKLGSHEKTIELEKIKNILLCVTNT